MSITALSNSQTSIHHLPNDVLLQILQYLSPQDKKVVAAVCHLWQRLAEDPRSLLADYTEGKHLFARQLSKIFASAEEGSELQYEITSDVFRHAKFLAVPFIPEKTVTRMLNLFTTYSLPKGPLDTKACYLHLSRLELFELGLHSSSSAFSIEKITKIFHAHIESMQNQGFNINNHSNYLTPLASAVNRKCPALIRALCLAGAQVNGRSSDSNNSMPIHYIIRSRLDRQVTQQRIEQCLKALLDYEADINGTTTRGNLTPLWSAANCGQDEIVEMLVKNGANINFTTNSTFNDSTALQAAICRGHLSTVKTLIKLGADHSIVSGTEAKTLSQLAKYSGNKEIEEFLDGLQPSWWQKKFKQFFCGVAG